MVFRKMAMIYGILCLLLCGCAPKHGGGTDGKDEETEPTETETAETDEPHIRTDAEKAAETLAQMSTADKAGQLITMAVRIWNEEYFTEMNDEVRELFSKYHFGGFCVFRENFTDDNATAIRLNHDLQAAVTESGGVPMMISTDQEGGSVYRLVDGTMTPGNMALAAGGDPQNAYRAASIIGEELRAMGINTDLAPDTDVNSNPANPVIGIRSFSDDPHTVAVYAEEYVRGLNTQKITAALKHYPGHGDTDTDSHTGLPRIDKTMEELKASDLIPFAEMIRDGYDGMIMSAHIQFPKIETQTYTSKADGSEISLPATLSKALLNDLLRGELGFKGVVITDSMIMDAIAAHFDPLDAAQLAVNAGADILLMPLDIRGSEDLKKADAYMEGLIARIEDGSIPEKRVNEAVERILTLKYRSGIMDEDYSGGQTEKMISSAKNIVGSPSHHETEIAIADETATVVENSGILPLSVHEGMNIVLAGMNRQQANALGYAYNRLEKEGVIPKGINATVYDCNWTNDYWQVYNVLEETDVLIMTESMYSPVLIDPAVDSQLPSVAELIDDAHAYGIDVIVISCALPYDLALLGGADAVLAVYNQMGIADCDEAFNPYGTYGPNIIGAMDVIFGKVPPKGKLPVNIPAVSGGAFASGYIYERGDGLTW